jgi:hypothetical protein
LEVLLTKIDDLTRDDHWHLTHDDECFAVREYIARGGWQAGETNNLIHNLKKAPDRRGLPEWRYKERAIRQVGSELRAAFLSGGAKWLKGAVLVPMPPSKSKEDAAYDDRMIRVTGIMCEGTGAEIRELLVQRESTDAHHLQERSRDIDAIRENLRVEDSLCKPIPPRIAIVDDVLTTGAHFRAAKMVLNERFPAAHIIGVFVARRVIVNEDEDEDEDDG